MQRNYTTFTESAATNGARTLLDDLAPGGNAPHRHRTFAERFVEAELIRTYCR